MNITAINPYHIQNQVKKLNAKQSAETSDNRTVSQEKLPATDIFRVVGTLIPEFFFLLKSLIKSGIKSKNSNKKYGLSISKFILMYFS